MSTRQVADVLKCTPARVLAALKRHGITMDPRWQAIPPLPADAPTMFDVYVTQRLDDATIAQQYNVPTWRVTKKRRELGVHRPPAPTPRRSIPAAPAPGELRRLQRGRRPHDGADRPREPHLETSGPDVAGGRPDPDSATNLPGTPQAAGSGAGRRAVPRAGNGEPGKSPHHWTSVSSSSCAPCTITASQSAAVGHRHAPPAPPPSTRG